LNLARSQIFTAAVVLIKNALARLGAAWVDDLGMEAAFGEGLERRERGRERLQA
jgi:hypothetical protein